MKNKLTEIENSELMMINGGGWLYDLYRIIVEEKDDFVAGFKDGFNNGAF